MADETGGPPEVELSTALQAYLSALEEFELAVTSAGQQAISAASRKVFRALQQLARAKEQFERGEEPASPVAQPVLDRASNPPA